MNVPARAEAATRIRRSLVTALGIYVVPAILSIQVVRILGTGEWYDFDANVWAPIHAVLAGQSPYPAPELSAIVGHPTLAYPPLLLWADLPFAAFPHDVARILFGLVSALAVFAGLRAVGVRDHRCLAVGVLSLPVVFGLGMGNPTLLLVLPLALAWRYRDKPWAVGVAVAVVIGVKPLLWPLGVWLLVTRRFRGTAIGIVAGGTALLGTWAAIGFHGLIDYPRLVALIGEKTAGPRALSIKTLAHDIGLSAGTGRAIQLLCGVALLVALVLVARGRDGDRRAFSLAVAAALVLSPVMWLHYLALLLVPLAIAAPAYGAAWYLPQLLWLVALMPRGEVNVVSDGGHVYGVFGVVPPAPKVLLVLGFVAAVAAVTGFDREAPRTRLPRLRSLRPQPQRALP